MNRRGFLRGALGTAAAAAGAAAIGPPTAAEVPETAPVRTNGGGSNGERVVLTITGNMGVSGEKVVKAIKEYERRNGNEWRTR